jgi:ribonuclease E
MEAAFIDIGTPKNGVLYRGDVLYDENDMEGGEKPRIERVLRGGQSIIVQVTKNPIGHKGARLTQEVSLAGRFVVMVPGQPQTYGISKRLPDDERKRLRRVLDRVRPADAGLIVRTAAEGATEDELERDLRRLEAQWKQISELAKRAKAGSLLYKEPELAIRIIREEFTKEYRGIVIDDPKLYEEVRSYVDAVSPELTDRVEYYDEAEENLPVFERFHVHEQLHKALDRKVWLPSGAMASTASSSRNGAWWVKINRPTPASSASACAYSTVAWPNAVARSISDMTNGAPCTSTSTPHASVSADSCITPSPSAPGPRRVGQWSGMYANVPAPGALKR